MKKLALALALTLVLPALCHAGPSLMTKTVFSGYSGMNATDRPSIAYSTPNYFYKQAIWSGQRGAAFNNSTGVMTIQERTEDGPWTIVAQFTNSTTDGNYRWWSLATQVRFSWKRTSADAVHRVWAKLLTW